MFAFALAATGCSLTTTEVTDCRTNAECRRQFGIGTVCGDDGLCTEASRLSRCNTTFPEDLLFDVDAHRDTIIFGNLMDRSLETHRAREQSARLAFKQVNEAGGIDQRAFGVVFCTIENDTEFDFLTRQEAAVAAARYLVDVVGVPAIVGPASSGDTQAVFEEVRDDRVVVISPSATSPVLSDLEVGPFTDDNPGLLWRTAPPDSLQGAAIAYDMRNPGAGRAAPVDRVAVIHDDTVYGESLQAVFVAAFDAAGGQATQLPFDNEGQRDDHVSTASVGPYDEVLFISSQTQDVIAFMNAAAPLPGFDGKGIFLSDSGANSDLLTSADPARFPQVRGTRQAPLDEETDLVYASFIASYSAEYGQDVRPFSFTANAYDAAWLLAYASAWAILQEGGVSGVNLARGLRQISATGETPVDIRPSTWPGIVADFTVGDPVNVAGASGDLDYDDDEETSGRIQMWRIEDGAIVGVDSWPPGP